MLKISLSPAIGRLIIAAAVLVVLMLLPLALFAQEDGTIEYAENGTGAVATYTAVDPENAGAITLVVWTGDDDAEAFEIDKARRRAHVQGSPPDYEMAADGGAQKRHPQQYTVTVVATDADGMTTDERKSRSKVTNVDEAGTVTLSAVAPYPAVVNLTCHA